MVTNSVPAGIAGSFGTTGAGATATGAGAGAGGADGVLKRRSTTSPPRDFGSGTAAGFGAGAGALSPSRESSAIGALTFTPSAPSGTSSFAMRPSSIDSNSMV